MAQKEIRIITKDYDKNGKADAVIIEFYLDGAINYAVEATDKKETGFAEIASYGEDMNNDGKIDDLDIEALKQLANISLRLQ